MNLSDVYRLEALLELASAFPDSLTAREVARRRGVSRTFVARLLGELARERLVATARGPRGGVRLPAPPEEISLARVLHTEGPREGGGPAVEWLARHLVTAEARTLAPLTLAKLLQVEREHEEPPSYEI